jgi:hypothetical protein
LIEQVTQAAYGALLLGAFAATAAAWLMYYQSW